MQTKVAALLCLVGVSLATVQRSASHLAQIGQSAGLPQQIFSIADPQTDYNNRLTNVDGPALTTTLDDCELSTTTVEECVAQMKVDWTLFGGWPALDAYFHHQVDCWRTLASDLGIQSFAEFPDFPWYNTYSAISMPNSRHYEHFYDRSGDSCNQIWEMGRGRVQPDAITFGHIPPHTHNVILSRDRMSITPWVTHDERVLQFEGITDSCVELIVQDEYNTATVPAANSGQGLARNQWRIEYYDIMGMKIEVNSTHLVIPDPAMLDLVVTHPDTNLQGGSELGSWGDIEGGSLAICRTPFYLQVCQAEAGPVNKGVGGCEAGCMYFPAFTRNDAELSSLTRDGIYEVPCAAGHILSFNGTRPFQADDMTKLVSAQTPELWFADKCASENFLMLDGQEVHLRENYLGTLEILVPTSVCDDTDFDNTLAAITHHLDDGSSMSFTYMTICDEFGTAGHADRRFFVTAKKGAIQMCWGQCLLEPTQNCPIIMDSASNGGVVSMDTRFVVGGAEIFGANGCVSGTNMDANMNMCAWYADFPAMCGFFDVAVTFIANDDCCECGVNVGATGDPINGAIASADGDGEDNYLVTTTGAVVLDGMAGDDILEDHNAEALLAGGAGNDRLISRNGRDALWGGNPFRLNECTDGIAAEVDSQGNTCVYYNVNPQMCGNFDDADFDAAMLCCICGHASTTGPYLVTGMTITGENVATEYDVETLVLPFRTDTMDPKITVANLGDADTYVIYPTTEKSLYRASISATQKSNGNLKNRDNECTKVFGFIQPDTLEFRLDDPTVEDHKFTDTDDECAFDVDGWELIWWLGEDYVLDIDTATDTITFDPMAIDPITMMPTRTATSVPRAATSVDTSLDIYFSRPDRKVSICPVVDSTTQQTGIPSGQVDLMTAVDANDWAYFQGTCRPIDDDCIEYDMECPDLDPFFGNIDADQYLQNQSTLQWFGWW